MSGVVCLAIGFAIGWLVFERPQFVTDLFDKLKIKIGLK